MNRLTLFGPADLRTVDDRSASLVLSQGKHVALLAILAMAHPVPVPRERLLALLWPELDEARARNAVSKALHACRRVFGDDSIVGRSAEELALSSDRWWCDVWAFRDALDQRDIMTALERYTRGRLLDGRLVVDAAAFDHWLDDERSMLRQRVLELTHRSATEALRAGAWSEAERMLTQAAGVEPLDERLFRLRLQVHEAHGDRAGALQLYAAFVDRLRAELEISPSADTVALAERIRSSNGTASAAVRTVPLTADAAPIVSAPADSASASASESAPVLTPHGNRTTATPAAAANTRERGPTEHGPPVRHMVGISALVVATLGLVSLMRGTPAVPSAPVINEPVVVAPFVNQSGDSTLNALGEMAADILSASLVRSGVAHVLDTHTRLHFGLSVINRDAINDTERLATLARDAGATRIVTGTFAVVDSQLVFSAMVRYAHPDSVPRKVAVESAPRRDPAQVVQRLERRLLGVFASLRDPRIPAASAIGSSIPSYPAYQEYVKGLSPYVADDAKTAVEHFERAYALDSNFLAMIPMLTELLVQRGRGKRADSLLARLGARRTQLLPFDRAQIEFWLAFRSGERRAMFDATQRMIAMAPFSPDAQWSHSFAATGVNRFAEAATAFARARERGGWVQEKLFTAGRWPLAVLHLQGDAEGAVNLAQSLYAKFRQDAVACYVLLQQLAMQAPLAQLETVLTDCRKESGGVDEWFRANVRLQIAEELMAHRRATEARAFVTPVVRFAQTALERAPDDIGARGTLANALMFTGEWATAFRHYDQLLRTAPDPSPRMISNAGVTAAHVGKTAVADSLLQRLVPPATGPQFVRLYRARILAHLGRTREALGELDTAMTSGLMAAEVLHPDFGYAPLRGMPGFERLFAPR